MGIQEKLTLDFRDEHRSHQSIGKLQVSGEDLLNVLCLFDPYGLWRMETDSGLVYWTEDVFRIHRMKASNEPVNMVEAVALYHPDDRDYLTKLLEETVEKKSGFRFVLRLKRRTGGYKLVKSTGRYRETLDGTAEIFGTFSEFQAPNRAVAIYG